MVIIDRFHHCSSPVLNYFCPVQDSNPASWLSVHHVPPRPLTAKWLNVVGSVVVVVCADVKSSCSGRRRSVTTRHHHGLDFQTPPRPFCWLVSVCCHCLLVVYVSCSNKSVIVSCFFTGELQSCGHKLGSQAWHMFCTSGFGVILNFSSFIHDSSGSRPLRISLIALTTTTTTTTTTV